MSLADLTDPARSRQALEEMERRALDSLHAPDCDTRTRYGSTSELWYCNCGKSQQDLAEGKQGIR